MTITVHNKQYTLEVSQKNGWVRGSLWINDGHLVTIDTDDEQKLVAEATQEVESHLSNERGWYAWEHGGEQHCQ